MATKRATREMAEWSKAAGSVFWPKKIDVNSLPASEPGIFQTNYGPTSAPSLCSITSNTVHQPLLFIPLYRQQRQETAAPALALDHIQTHLVDLG